MGKMRARAFSLGLWPLLSAALLSAAFAGRAAAQDPEELFRTDFSAGPENPPRGGLAALTVKLRLARDAHVYTEGLGFEWQAVAGLSVSNLQLPAPSRIEDPSAPGESIDVLADGDEIKVFFRVTGAIGAEARISGRLSFSGCTDICFPPFKREFSLVLGRIAEPDAGAGAAGPPLPQDPTPAAGPGPKEPAAGEPSSAPSGREAELPEPGTRTAPRWDLWLLLLKILQAFGIGFLISLTPCVYPMIGITAAVVGGSGGEGERRVGRAVLNSAVYVLGISLTYSVLGVLTALAGAPFASALKTGWVLLPVSGLFLLLALNMFDVIQLQTPAFLKNRLSRVGRRGSGTASRFVLGLVSGVVATPCVAAPLIATLLEIATLAADRGLATGVVFGLAMLFSLAWGMGLVLVAAGVLTASVLPRSGPWMLWVKNLFGFGMLWAAVYFALPVLGGPLYDLLTALIIFAGVVFLGGLDRLTPESTLFHRARQAAALPALVMAALLFAGALNDLTDLFPWLDCGRTPAAAEGAQGFRAGTLRDVDLALASKKPVVVDFHAPWCKVCKKLEKKVFSDPRVKAALSSLEAVKIDYDADQEAVRRFQVMGVPTVVFLGPDGRERKDLRFSGELSPEEFLEKLDALLK